MGLRVEAQELASRNWWLAVERAKGERLHTHENMSRVLHLPFAKAFQCQKDRLLEFLT